MQKTKNKTYSAEFKAAAVKQANESELPVSETARNLGVNVNTLFTWIQKYSEPVEKDEGHVLISYDGVICGYSFAAANIDERDVLQDMTDGLTGTLIGDKGYIRPCLKEDLARQGLDLQTPLRKNMKDDRPKNFVTQLMKTRRLVETVIGQLTERFHIEKVRARNCWHLINRFIRKLLAHTVGVYLNNLLGNPLLHFEALVEV
jgi:hypothetical protein